MESLPTGEVAKQSMIQTTYTLPMLLRFLDNLLGKLLGLFGNTKPTINHL